MNRFETATADDPSRNYCLWEYAPPAPIAGKHRSINLLYQAFELSGIDERAYELVGAIRRGIGPFRTVWGTKWVAGRLGWELYFYDYERQGREVSIPRVLDAIRPIAPSAVRVDDRQPYFMFSLDVDDRLVRGERELDVVHMYIGNVGSIVSSGIAYAMTPREAYLENFYFFYDAKRQLAEAADKIFCSAWVDASKLAVDEILLPELRDCQTICVANKRTTDCVYFSGVNVDQLLFFLQLVEYPPQIVAFVRDNRDRLDHLLYDVGLDYRMEDGRLRWIKSGYYGVF